MEQKRSFAKAFALALAVVVLLPVMALLVSACGGKKPADVYYTVTFYSDDRTTVLSSVKVKEGEDAVFTGTPTKTANNRYYYEFKYWLDENNVQADLTAVKSDFSVYAYFEQKYVMYTLTKPAQVTVTRGGSSLQNGNVLRYGDSIIVSYTVTPGKRMSDFKVNGVKASNNSRHDVRGNVEIVYQEVDASGAAETFSVTFLGPTGSAIEVQEVEKNSKATAPNYSSRDYTVVKWNYDFDAVVTEDATVTGYFVKNNEKLDGVSANINAGSVGSSWTLNLRKGNLVYDYFESIAGEGNVPASIEISVGEVDKTVSINDKFLWGDITYSLLLNFPALSSHVWAGYFEDVDVISFDAKELEDTTSENIYFVRDGGAGSLSGTYSVYTSVYGLTGRHQVSGTDKYEGVKLETNQIEKNLYKLTLSKGNPIYEYLSLSLSGSQVPSSIDFRRTEWTNTVDEMIETSLGHVDMVSTFVNETYGLELTVGRYDEYDILVLDTSEWMNGLTNLYFIGQNGTYFLYKSFNAIEIYENLATVQFIDFNGDEVLSEKFRVGASIPTNMYLTSEIEGYSIVVTMTDELVLPTGNRVKLTYVKDDEYIGARIVFRADIGEDGTEVLYMDSDSEFYKKLVEIYKNEYGEETEVPTELIINYGECIDVTDEYRQIYGDVDYLCYVTFGDFELNFVVGQHDATISDLVFNLESSTDDADRVHFVITEAYAETKTPGYIGYKKLYTYAD